MPEPEIRAAKIKISKLSSHELYEIWEKVKLKNHATTANALAVLKFLESPLTYEDLMASQILSQGTLPEPHGTLFFTLVTNQEYFMEHLPEADIALRRDKMILEFGQK